MTEYWMLPSTGNDGNGGTSETDAVQTFAIANALLSNGDKLWVKAEASIILEDGVGVGNAIFKWDSGGTATAPIYCEGYHTTEGDGGVVTLDASSAALSFVVDFSGSGDQYISMENFTFTGASSRDVASASDDTLIFINCSFVNSGNIGVDIGDNCRLINCLVRGNTGTGLNANDNFLAINTILEDNAGQNATIGNGLFINCLSDELTAGDEAFHFTSPQNNVSGAINVSSDCFGLGTTSGVQPVVASGANLMVFNAIVYDGVWGFRAATDVPALYEWMHCEHNAFSSNTTDVSRMTAVTDQDGSFVTSSVPFNLPDGSPRDYRPKIGSELRGAGHDVADTVAFWASYDDGDNPPVPGDEEYVSHADIGAIQAEPIRRRTVPRRIQ